MQSAFIMLPFLFGVNKVPERLYLFLYWSVNVYENNLSSQYIFTFQIEQEVVVVVIIW